MMLPLVALTVCAAALILFAGYLIGIQRDRAVRAVLAEDLVQRDKEIQSLESLRQELDRRERGERDLRLDIRSYLKPFIPLVEREQISRKLASIEAPDTPHGALSVVLEEMAQRAGFSSLLLSDATGLPLATNQKVLDSDALAAMAAGVISLAERVTLIGLPGPQAVLTQHEGGRICLQRIFRLGGEAYVLTAVTRGVLLLPDVLDPALPMIERILERKPWE